ncbi:MAG: hypothetical protein M3443_19020 [Actinomycetota bacterium]|nr:hypothetical protein [Actinomycetota bacterium]
MSVFTITSHTRAEEDSGRLELLGSTVIGRVSHRGGQPADRFRRRTLTGVELPAAGSFMLGLVFTAVAGGDRAVVGGDGRGIPPS